MSVADKLLQVNQVKQDIKTAIENKGVDLTGVDFGGYAGKIDEIQTGGGGMTYEDYARTLYLGMGKSNKFATAWEHSLLVDPTEISENSSSPSPRGKAQYPNGETEGVIIPQGVTSIGDAAFYDWSSNNQPLIIPNSVTSIGNWTFHIWSSNNHPLVIPNSVTSIGQNAFYAWSSNNHPLVIPNSITSIGGSAFNNWSSNNHPLVIPKSITTLNHSVFFGWSSNNHPLVIPNSITSIGISAFNSWSSNNHPLVIPNSVTSIGLSAFNSWQQVPYIEMQSTTPPTLANSSAFNNQNNAPIYVPDGSLDDYKTATNWVDLADRIFPMSERP